MITVIQVMIAINTLGLLAFIAAYFIMNEGKKVDSMEKGWTFILAVLGLLVILLAAIPLYFSHATITLIFSGLFSFLPVSVLIAKKIPSFKNNKTFAETYYRNKTQRRIAAAIEQNDLILLKELIQGRDLNIPGTRLWDQDGLNYLQFAVRLRSNPISFPFNDASNTAIIRLLIAHGAATSPALAEATRYLPADMISLLLDAGANPNGRGFTSSNPILFDVIGHDKKLNDIAILLMQRGADIDAKNDEQYTPLMFAALRAGTTAHWADAWRLVRYLLEEAHADYRYTTAKGISLNSIVRNISREADEKKITMPADFMTVMTWLEEPYMEIVTR